MEGVDLGLMSFLCVALRTHHQLSCHVVSTVLGIPNGIGYRP